VDVNTRSDIRLQLTDYELCFQPEGKDQEIDFSDVPNIGSYIPEVKSGLFAHPLLVCDSDAFDGAFIEW
jgi:hypothetical protein